MAAIMLGGGSTIPVVSAVANIDSHRTISMDRVKDKVALITGGAMGLGKAAAHRLAQEGAKVVITDVHDAEGQAVAAAIIAAGGEAKYFHHDVALEADWVRVMDEAMTAFGRLDVVVNNAGVGTTGTIENTSFADYRKLMSINLDGVFLGTQYGIAALKKSKSRGSIINLSSIEGLIGDPNLAAYNASKGGVRLLTKSAALHCAKTGTGIRVNSIHPGYILTPMVEGIVAHSPDAKAAQAALVALHPIGHLGEPNDIAWGIVYLASDEAKFITGSELVIDGGYTAQ
jgi:NAD(P)-dependent dehydrogenase (short-subunit alcohol dehydrogenase family)